MASTDDNSILLLTAGFKLLMLERKSLDWTSWTTRLSLQETFTFDNAIINVDGSVLAYVCGVQGVCVWRYNASTQQYDHVFTAPPLLGLYACEFQFSHETQPLLVIGYCMHLFISVDSLCCTKKESLYFRLQCDFIFSRR
jgi:hypothetical protein